MALKISGYSHLSAMIGSGQAAAARQPGQAPHSPRALGLQAGELSSVDRQLYGSTECSCGVVLDHPHAAAPGVTSSDHHTVFTLACCQQTEAAAFTALLRIQAMRTYAVRQLTRDLGGDGRHLLGGVAPAAGADGVIA